MSQNCGEESADEAKNIMNKSLESRKSRVGIITSFFAWYYGRLPVVSSLPRTIRQRYDDGLMLKWDN